MTFTMVMLFYYRNSSLSKNYGGDNDRVERGRDETTTANVTTPDASGAGQPDNAGACLVYTPVPLDK